jgi:hypothetical protein
MNKKKVSFRSRTKTKKKKRRDVCSLTLEAIHVRLYTGNNLTTTQSGSTPPLPQITTEQPASKQPQSYATYVIAGVAGFSMLVAAAIVVEIVVKRRKRNER